MVHFDPYPNGLSKNLKSITSGSEVPPFELGKPQKKPQTSTPNPILPRQREEVRKGVGEELLPLVDREGSAVHDVVVDVDVLGWKHPGDERWVCVFLRVPPFLVI